MVTVISNDLINKRERLDTNETQLADPNSEEHFSNPDI